MALGLPRFLYSGSSTLKKGLLASATVLLAAGCSGIGDGSAPPPRVYDPGIRIEAEQQLAQSAARAANALETLALVQRAQSPPPAPAIDEGALPATLRTTTTVDFSGPASGILRDLARDIGYGFFETGNARGDAVLVTVVARDQAVGRVLSDVGGQIQRVATVVVDPEAKRIELRHEPGFAPSPRGGRQAAQPRSNKPSEAK